MAKGSHPLPTPSPGFQTQRPGWIMRAAWPCNVRDFSEALESCRADPAAAPPPPNPNLELYQQNELSKGGGSEGSVSLPPFPPLYLILPGAT